MSAESDLGADKAPNRPVFDRVLNVIGATLLISVLGAGAFLAYSVAEGRAIEQGATPRSRIINDLHAQITQSPDDASLRVRLGEVYAASGLHNQAVKELEAALELDPEHTGAYLVLGMVGMMQKDHEAAEANFLKVIELTEDSEFKNLKLNRELAYYYLGETALDTSRFEDAIGYFKAAIRMNKASANAYFGLGLAFRGIDDRVAAMEQFEIALTFDPKFAQAHYEMGQLYLAEDDRINAAVHFAEAAMLAPDNPLPAEALSSLGTADEWEGKAREALASGENEAALEAALITRALVQDELAYVVLHAEVLEAKGERDDALDVYAEALTMAPNDSGIQAAIARLESE